MKLISAVVFICAIGLLMEIDCNAQGLFRLSGQPSANDLLKRKGFTWESVSTEHFRFHFEPKTPVEERLECLRSREEKSFSRVLQLLGAKNYPRQIDIFIVNSMTRMKALVGRETNGIAFPKTNVICFIFNTQTNASGAHEMMHVVAKNFWQGDPKPWLNEGLAVYADDLWYSHKLHDLGKHFLVNKKLVPLGRLVKDFKEYNSLISYPLAGSFVKFLYEQYGADKIRELWRKSAPEDITRILGKSLGELEREWRARLAQADEAGIKYLTG